MTHGASLLAAGGGEGVTRVLMLEPPLWEGEGTLRQDVRPLGTYLCPPAPGDQAAQLHPPTSGV